MKLITVAEVTRTVETRVLVYRCTECGVEFDRDFAGRAAAHTHALSHASIVYANTNGYGGIYVTENAVIREDGPYKMKTAVRHRIEGLTFIEWRGEGWYVLYEYEEVFRGERDHRKKFIPVKDAIEKVKETIKDVASDLRHYHDLRRRGKP